jgi:hypothetical protein
MDIALKTAPLQGTWWLPALSFSFVIWVYDECRKYLMRKYRHSHPTDRFHQLITEIKSPITTCTLPPHTTAIAKERPCFTVFYSVVLCILLCSNELCSVLIASAPLVVYVVGWVRVRHSRTGCLHSLPLTHVHLSNTHDRRYRPQRSTVQPRSGGLPEGLGRAYDVLLNPPRHCTALHCAVLSATTGTYLFHNNNDTTCAVVRFAFGSASHCAVSIFPCVVVL